MQHYQTTQDYIQAQAVSGQKESDFRKAEAAFRAVRDQMLQELAAVDGFHLGDIVIVRDDPRLYTIKNFTMMTSLKDPALFSLRAYLQGIAPRTPATLMFLHELRRVEQP